MIVAMWESASEDQIQDVTDHLMKMGFAVHRTTGARQSVLAAVGKRIDFDIRELEVLSGRANGTPHQRSLQAGGPSISSRGHHCAAGERRGNRRQRSGGDGWSLLGGIARTDLRRR